MPPRFGPSFTNGAWRGWHNSAAGNVPAETLDLGTIKVHDLVAGSPLNNSLITRLGAPGPGGGNILDVRAILTSGTVGLLHIREFDDGFASARRTRSVYVGAS